MRKIKHYLLLILITISYSCSEVDDDVCDNECYEVVSIEGANRFCSIGGCTYTFNVTLRSQCTNELIIKKTYPVNSINQIDGVGSTVCNLLSYQ